jgi:hypothetical protein
MSSAFLNVYCDELWAVVSPDWLNKDGLTPIGLNMSQLLDDLAKVADNPHASA